MTRRNIVIFFRTALSFPFEFDDQCIVGRNAILYFVSLAAMGAILKAIGILSYSKSSTAASVHIKIALPHRDETYHCCSTHFE